MADFDLAVIGGGINGTGIARDAAGRGLRVVLLEQNDLASGTSSASSKLIHGGLRYLEQWQFGLVRAALAEREVLLRAAPHLIRPLRFVLPVNEERRSAVVLKIGLMLYDWLGRRELLPGTRELDFTIDAAGAVLRHSLNRGFEYSDCLADDARLVVLNALDAAERGAVIRTRTRCTRGERGAAEWRLILNAGGQRDVVTARVVVNAAWVATVGETVLRQPAKKRLRLDKGSHIVVRRRFDPERAFILQAADRRVVFAIPFDRDLTLIGTTDQGFAGDPAGAEPTAAEIQYLCGVANEYFRAGIDAGDVVWAYAGVRALYDDGARQSQNVGRDYVLKLDAGRATAPLLTVYGGKITTYRRLAEDVMVKLAKVLPSGAAWTAGSALPGGDFAYDGFVALLARTQQRWPFLAADHAHRLVRAYGTRVDSVLQGVTGPHDLGARFGADMTATEVRYLMTKEWAQTADDVLWRRSKLGLHFSEAERASLDRFMAAHSI